MRWGRRSFAMFLIVTAALCVFSAKSLSGNAGTAGSRCGLGAVAAVIGGKRTCLRSGRVCKVRFARQYRRYGFRCVRGRLVAVPSGTGSLVVRRIDVGGYRLAIRCQGKGKPTVILESGFDTGGNEWFLVQPKAASTTRVCSYDRAGLGASDPRKPFGPAQASRVIEELHVLLARAGVGGPYVFAGHSYGAFFARLYTERYPEQVAALVSVDGSPLGLDPAPAGADLVQGRRESFYVSAANDELAAAPSLGSRPLIVLTRGRAELSAELESAWLHDQVRVSGLSTDATLVRVDNSGHDIPSDNPAIIVEALRQAVNAVRNHAPLPPCLTTELARLEGTCLDSRTPMG